MTRMFKTITKTWNIFSGCRFDCNYCITPESRILMVDFSWKAIGDIKVGECVLGFDEQPPTDGQRKLKPSIVTQIFDRKVYSDIYTLVTPNSEVVVTGEHPWLHDRGWWSTTKAFAWQGSTLKGIGIKPINLTDIEYYNLGYLRGMCDGDATLNPIHQDRKHPSWFRLALSDFDALNYVQSILVDHGIDVPRLKFSNPGKPMEMLQTQSAEKVRAIVSLLNTDGLASHREYCRGWLAGIFDAEGTHSDSIRIANTDSALRQRIIHFGKHLTLTFVEERKGCRFIGRTLDFLSTVRPKITRKTNVEGLSRWGVPQGITVTPRRTNQKGLHVMNLETTTSTYICEGLASHNCWARPLIEGRLAHLPKYKAGFEPTFHSSELAKKFRPREFVAIALLGDISFATADEVEAIAQVIEKFPKTRFLFQSKDPSVFHRSCFPKWPHVYYGTTLETSLYEKDFSRAPSPIFRAYHLSTLKCQHKFVSIEPVMDFRVKALLIDLPGLVGWIHPDIVEIGADNYRHALPEPPWSKVRDLIQTLREFVPKVVEKDGLRRLEHV